MDQVEMAREALERVEAQIVQAAREVGRNPDDITLIAVSKTFDADRIRPVLQAGHRHFGENRVQEAAGKWPELRGEFPDLTLHLIGPLQSNKAADAVGLFDAIHSIDRPKIARAIASETVAQSRKLQLFIQINTGEEPQKAGVIPKDAPAFIALCRDELGLEISGLMCIPPVDDAAAVHFAFLAKLAEENGVRGLSMGMSADYDVAVQFGATHVRVGSAIFGARG
ncbi:MAG: YggS family pyridoxal phosphate-dependent enzyme [Pseudomonadota bacterium]